MNIKRIIIKGYKVFRDFDLSLNKELNILVGDNEAGKTTLLEAIHLVLECHLDGRNLKYELNPYIFNTALVSEYFAEVHKGGRPTPPEILIEAYFNDEDSSEAANIRGTNNSLREDCPGLYLKVELNEAFSDEFQTYTHSPENPEIIPIEYYALSWRSFADNDMESKKLPLRSTIIDTSLLRGYFGPNRYLAKLINENLDETQRRLLSMAFRRLKDSFFREEGIKEINRQLEAKKGDITEKSLSISMDLSSRSSWDSTIAAHLDNTPFEYVGKGEQSRVQMKLAIEAACDSGILLVEEPENHLSHSNMCRLIDDISERCSGRQIVLTTHSSFVLNRLGINRVKLLSLNSRAMTLDSLSSETKEYFRKLPGYNTLRLLLSHKTILVEGPSDELLVQRAYRQIKGRLPLDSGIDVISVGSLSFRRFLEIGKLLMLNIHVLADNDGNVAALKEKYAEYLRLDHIKICFDSDDNMDTLETQLLKANSLSSINEALGTSFSDKDRLLKHMKDHKTDTALRLFDYKNDLNFPDSIRDVIVW